MQIESCYYSPSTSGHLKQIRLYISTMDKQVVSFLLAGNLHFM